MPVTTIAEAFKSFRIGRDTAARLAQGPDKAAMDTQSEGIELLVKKKYALTPGQLFAACWQVGPPLVIVTITLQCCALSVVVCEKLMWVDDTRMEQCLYEHIALLGIHRIHCLPMATHA